MSYTYSNTYGREGLSAILAMEEEVAVPPPIDNDYFFYCEHIVWTHCSTHSIAGPYIPGLIGTFDSVPVWTYALYYIPLYSIYPYELPVPH